MRKFTSLAVALLLGSTAAQAEIKVMASIKPVHSLVASVMQGVGTPGLIVDGAGSPHTYSLKPSEAAALEQAQVVFWIGHELESFLEKPLETLASKAMAVSLLDVDGLTKLPPREGNGFDAHEEKAEGEGEGEHDHGEEVDAHIWLDPANAELMVSEIARTLSKTDPANAKIFAANATSKIAELKKLATDIEAETTPLKGKGFIVFHDAYQYFEKRFGLSATGAISINPENPPGAAGIAELRKRVADGKAICILAEPQFDNKLVQVIAEGSAIKSAVLDPLGANLEPGPALYDTLLRDMAKSLRACLG